MSASPSARTSVGGSKGAAGGWRRPAGRGRPRRDCLNPAVRLPPLGIPNQAQYSVIRVVT
jgi:hypothetical protein